MAETNFGILDTQLPGRIAAIPQQAQAQQTQNMLTALQAQHSMNQNELARYQLSSARRADSEAEQMRALFGGATPTSMTDPEFIRKIYAINPKEGIALEKANAERTKLGVDLANTRSQTTERDIKIKTAKADAFAARLAPLAAGLAEGKTVTHDDVFTVMRGLIDEGLATQQDMQHIPQKADEIPAFVKRLVSANDNARKALAFYQPEPLVAGGGVFNKNPNAPGGIMAPLGNVPMTADTAARLPILQGNLDVARGNLGVNRATAMDSGIDLSGVGGGGNAMRPPGVQPAVAPVNAMVAAPTAGAPVAGVPTYPPKMVREMAAKGMQPDGKGGQTFIPGGEKDPDAIARIEAAKAQGAATGKDTAAAVRTLPNAIASSQKAISNIDAMLGDARVVGNKITYSKTAPHPGFSDAVGAGIGLRFIPGTEASNFQERFREITSGAFLEAFESLRGGGSITEKEGEKATAAKTRMSLAQSEKEFVTAAREYQNIIRVGVGRAQERLSKAQAVSGGNTGGGGAGSWGKAVAE